MASRDTAIRALCKSLGKDYKVCTIDLERVIYRDFGNGFNVEISGVHTTSLKKKATLYLWFGDAAPECIVVKTVKNVAKENISEEVEALLAYSNELLSAGIDSRNKIRNYVRSRKNGE